MTINVAERIAYITSKLQKLGFHNTTLIAYRPGPSNVGGYFKLRAIKHDYKIFISELLIKGSVIKYSYTLLYGEYDEKVILRYDNAPHHPYIETFPHHKHKNDKVKPLKNHSIDSFIEEVESIIKENRSLWPALFSQDNDSIK